MRYAQPTACEACLASPLHVRTDTINDAVWTIDYDDALDRHFTERVCADHLHFMRRHYKKRPGEAVIALPAPQEPR